MSPVRRGAVVSLMLGVAAPWGHAAPAAEAAAPGAEASAVVRSMIFRPGPSDRVTPEMVAKELAQQLPASSSYGPLREGKRSYEKTSISAAGVQHSGNWSAPMTGVRASVRGTSVLVSYIKGDTGTKGDYLGSPTRCTIDVGSDPRDPTQFSAALKDCDQKIARGLLFGQVDPLDTKEAIVKDLTTALANVRVTVGMNSLQETEIEAPYPPAAVFANFERILGRSSAGAANRTTTTAATDGRFAVKDGKDLIDVTVKVFPYRNGSKIKLAYGLTYALADDGSNTYDAGQSGRVLEVLKRVATD